MSSPGKFRDAQRLQLSVLAPAEKRVLLWLAARMPRWVNSDHLTALGLLSLAGAGLAYWYSSRNILALHLVNLCLALNWFGDSLDGTLARFRNRLRPRYGFYVDHVVDTLGTLFLLGGLGASGFMSPAVAIGLLVVYYLLSIEVYLATYVIGSFHISFWKMGPTELRLLLVIGNLYLLYRPDQTVPFLGRDFRLFDFGGVIGIIGMAGMMLQSTMRHTAQLYREEKLP